MTHDPIIEQELLTHAAALRRLARTLVGKQDADDLVQDVALEALRTPPRTPGGMGGWLAGVARHVASRRRRTERSRVRREQIAARPEALPACEDPSRGETLRRLNNAVLSLPEPYRQTVLLRYLRGMPPRAIAEQVGEPVATIKSRLQRALAMLRSSFECETGPNWRASIAIVFALDPPSAVGTLATTSAINRGLISWLMSKPGLAAASVLFTLSIVAVVVATSPTSVPAAVMRAGMRMPSGDAAEPSKTGNAELDELRRLAVVAPIEELVDKHVVFLMLRDLNYRDDEVLWRGVARMASEAVKNEQLKQRRQIAGLTAASIDKGSPPPELGLKELLPELKRIDK